MSDAEAPATESVAPPPVTVHLVAVWVDAVGAQSPKPVKSRLSSLAPTPLAPILPRLDGPSLDFDDPVELLAIKCAEALPPGVTAPPIRRVADAIGGVELNPSHANQVFFPLYHFEKSGCGHRELHSD